MSKAQAFPIIFGLLLVALPLRAESAEQGRTPSQAPMTQETKAAEKQSTATEETMNLSWELRKTVPAPSFTPIYNRGLFVKTHTLDESQLGRLRGPFWVPQDVTLLSRNKPVTSSVREPVIGELAMITDGDKDCSVESSVELDPGRQWVQIDLFSVCEVFAVVIWHYHASPRVYFDVVVQYADDRDFTKCVKTVFNNDHDGSAGFGIGKDREYLEANEGKLIDFKQPNGKPARTRYLRFYSNGNWSNDSTHYVEIEVYGRRVKR